LPVASAKTTQPATLSKDYTELGAGFKVAMRDLEIRAARGTCSLGFELYADARRSGRGRRGHLRTVQASNPPPSMASNPQIPGAI
jgi:hypothetical protein